MQIVVNELTNYKENVDIENDICLDSRYIHLLQYTYIRRLHEIGLLKTGFLMIGDKEITS